MKFIVTIIYTAQNWEQWDFDTRPEADNYCAAMNKRSDVEQSYVTVVRTRKGK